MIFRIRLRVAAARFVVQRMCGKILQVRVFHAASVIIYDDEALAAFLRQMQRYVNNANGGLPIDFTASKTETMTSLD